MSGRIGPVVKTLINAQTYNANTTVDISDAVNGIQWTQYPVFQVKATEVNNGTTLDISITSSLDGGGNYDVTSVSMTQLSASGNEAKVVAIPPYGEKARINLVFGGAGYNWTVTAKIAGMARGAGY
jgi:hypothetical protein